MNISYRMGTGESGRWCTPIMEYVSLSGCVSCAPDPPFNGWTRLGTTRGGRAGGRAVFDFVSVSFEFQFRACVLSWVEICLYKN